MVLSWLESTGCKDFSLLIHGVIPILDAVGEYLRFILFLDDLYGRMSDRVFPKTTYVDFLQIYRVVAKSIFLDVN